MSHIIDHEDEFVPDFCEIAAKFDDLTSADVAVALLERESVRAKVAPFRSVPGPPVSFQVLVDPRQLHRARWILQDSDLTDAPENHPKNRSGLGPSLRSRLTDRASEAHEKGRVKSARVDR